MEKKFVCEVIDIDYLTVNHTASERDGFVGLDMFRNNVNIGICLSKEQLKSLISELQVGLSKLE